jgi:hypothetical protein
MEIQEKFVQEKNNPLNRKETDFVMQKQNRKFWAFTDLDKQSASKALKYFAE